jgi:hypothetical protein
MFGSKVLTYNIVFIDGFIFLMDLRSIGMINIMKII